MPVLKLNTFAAAAGRLDVGIDPLETAGHQRAGKIQRRAVEKGEALGIDEHVDLAVLEGQHTVFRPGIHYAKCGVMLTELIAAGTEQRDLFDTRDEQRSQRLMTTLDAINRRMGRDTVFYAGSGIKRDWAAFANMKTQAFTTNWRQMMEVKV